MHGSLIVGMELRISQIEDKLSDVDARASEEADCSANDRDLDRFIYSGLKFIGIIRFTSSILYLRIILPKSLLNSHSSLKQPSFLYL